MYVSIFQRTRRREARVLVPYARVLKLFAGAKVRFLLI